MVPLARAVSRRGHDVLWAVGTEGLPAVERAGIRAVAVTAGIVVGPALVWERYPEIKALPPPDQPAMMFGKLFGAIIAPLMLAELVELVAGWRPDLVVCDAAELAGHIVAAELGVPSVTKGFGPLLPAPRVAAAGDEVAPLWRSRGLEPRPFGGMYETLYIDPYPPLLQDQGAAYVPHRQHIRPERDDGECHQDAPVPMPNEPADAPLVYLTMGTVFNDTRPLRMALEALSSLHVRVLVTVGPNADPGVLGDQPANVRVERYVPQSAVFASCDVVVSHGGSGTVLGALEAGLPQLCLPQGADQFLNAPLVAAAGAGLALSPNACNVQSIAGSVRRLLSESSFRAQAGRVSESIASMPSVDDVAAVLETLS